MIAFPQPAPKGVDLQRYRVLLGADADGLSDEQLQEQLEADRKLARALCVAISTNSQPTAIRVAG